MNLSRVAGILLLIIGVVLQPIGWMFFTWAAVVSFVCLVVGVLFLFRARTEDGGGSDGLLPSPTGREMPGDIYGYSGQLDGGRSEAWESHHSGHDDHMGN